MRRVSLVALLLAGGAAIHGATAQVVVSESTLTARISQSIEADTNYDLDADSPGTTYFGDTRLGVTLLQSSENQQLRFSLDTGLRPIDQPEQDFEWNLASPSAARFAFAQDFANNAFDIDVGARVNRVDRLIFDFDEDALFEDDFLLPEDVNLVSSDTLEQRLDLNTGFVLGTNSPSTVTLRLRATDIDYSGDNPEDFTPRSSAEAEVLWRLRFGPVLSSAVFGTYSYEDADNATDSDITDAEFDIGVIYEPSDDLSITVGGGYATRERRDIDAATGDRVTTEDDSGISLRAAVDYTTPDFNFGGNLRFTNAAPSARVSGDLRVNYQLLRSRITARVFQDFGFGSDVGDDERQVTGASLGYNYSLNELSSLGLNVSAATSTQADDDGGDDDRSDVNFTARYSRSITQVVDASLGYRLTQRFDDPDDATSHRVFFEVGRSFVTGF